MLSMSSVIQNKHWLC